MPQSFAKVYLRIVFSTKYRTPMIRPEIEKELFAFMGESIKKHKCMPVLINGMTDHVHVLCSFSRTVTIAKLLEDMKRNSSLWIKSKGECYHDFDWQDGYASFSVSAFVVDVVKKYIANQKSHHIKEAYKAELLRLLDEHGVEYDGRYMWD